jgi:hypothetical protein
MNVKYWQIIKDDTKRTFEVIGQATSENSLFNSTYAMQKSGMTVSSVSLPVNNKTSSKGLIKIPGYTVEEGLHERLKAQHREIIRSIDQWDE